MRNNGPAKVYSLDDLLVHQGGAIELGVVEPREECDLDHVVERDPFNQERHDVLGNREQSEDAPVREPLSVVGRVGRVDGLE